MLDKTKRALKESVKAWEMLVSYFPGALGQWLRYRYWRKKLLFLGDNVKIDIGVYFQNPQYISIDSNSWIDRGVILLAGPDASDRKRQTIANTKFPLGRGMAYIGKNVHIAPYTIISAIGGVYISDNCNIAAGSKIYSFSHHFRSKVEPWRKDIYFGPQGPRDCQFMVEGPIFLDENVGIALDSIILPGVTIGSCSYVLPKSVVISSFAENSLIAGNPARKLGKRFKDEKG